MTCAGIQADAKSRDSITAAQSFLLVAPAAADRHLFDNFTRIVNHYLEKPPFNFVNTLGIPKKVTSATPVTIPTNVRRIYFILGALVVTHAMLRRLTSWRCIIIINGGSYATGSVCLCVCMPVFRQLNSKIYYFPFSFNWHVFSRDFAASPDSTP